MKHKILDAEGFREHIEMDALEEKAREFATRKHHEAGQLRKYSGKPYIVHPTGVVYLLRLIPGITTAQFCAAWLHDTVEDTNTTIEEIKQEFGYEIASLVDELTYKTVPADGNREIRKAMDIAQSAAASPAAQTIKIADVIHNCIDAEEIPRGFVQVYLKEQKKLLEVLTEGHEVIHAAALLLIKEKLATTGKKK